MEAEGIEKKVHVYSDDGVDFVGYSPNTLRFRSFLVGPHLGHSTLLSVFLVYPVVTAFETEKHDSALHPNPLFATLSFSETDSDAGAGCFFRVLTDGTSTMNLLASCMHAAWSPHCPASW